MYRDERDKRIFFLELVLETLRVRKECVDLKVRLTKSGFGGLAVFAALAEGCCSVIAHRIEAKKLK